MESESYDQAEEQEEGEEEDLAELEALLYSQIYYQAEPDSEEKSDFTVSNCLPESPEKSGGLKTPGGDSGCGLSGPGSHVGSDIEGEEEEEEEISKYSISSNKITELVENPYFASECSSDTDSDDDGIIVVPKTPAKPIEIIEMDSSSNQSGSIVISDNENDEIKIVEELRTIDRKNNRKNIKDALPKRSKSSKLELGSDFSDNFLSSNESEGEGGKLSDADLTLNLSSFASKKTPKTLQELVGLQPDKYKSKSASNHDVPRNWTREMRKFYNEVDETYLEVDLQQILDRLPTDRECWRVDRADVYNLAGFAGKRQSRYWTGKKCNNCHQPGHLASHCPEPRRPERCRMCGESGHRETRCPDRCCLWCGQPGFDFLQSCLHCRKLRDTTCRTCGYSGHVARDCPDTWRRYHATTVITRQGEVRDPGNCHKPDRDCWCCNCGRRGHLVTDCHSYRPFKYPNTQLRVLSYKPDSWQLDNNPPQTEAGGTDKKKKKKKKSQSCPSTPKTQEVSFQSQPSSPARSQVFPSTLLVEKAISKLDKRKKSKETKEMKGNKEKLNHEIIRLLNCGKSKKQILGEILSSDVQDRDEEFLSKNKHLKSKQIKTAISTCMSQKRAETRQKEWKVERGFGKKKEKPFPRNDESQSPQSRANLIPTDSKAAVKFLKKEVQRQRGSKTSSQARRLSKELNQEIFGLKTLHSAGLLKKVERKRLADIVLQLREAN